jgi:hypothetical protein
MTLTWIVIAIAFVAGIVAYSARKKKNPVNGPESTQDTAQTTEQIAGADADSQYSASSSVMRPLADTETGQPDPDGHPATASLSTALGSDPGTGSQPPGQLLETDEMQPILGQWKDIQAEFVDEPRKAVQDADALVADVMQRLAQTFATEREQLEAQLEAQSADGDDVSTEDLRRSLRRYRSFFERLLAA